MGKTKTITKYYKAIIKISAEKDSSDESDIEEVASNCETWLSDAIIDDNYWGNGEFDVELITWKETKMAKNKK